MLKRYGHQVQLVDLNVQKQSLPTSFEEFDLAGLNGHNEV